MHRISSILDLTDSISFSKLLKSLLYYVAGLLALPSNKTALWPKLSPQIIMVQLPMRGIQTLLESTPFH